MAIWTCPPPSIEMKALMSVELPTNVHSTVMSWTVELFDGEFIVTQSGVVDTEDEFSPSPNALWAVTENEYSWPLISPSMK